MIAVGKSASAEPAEFRFFYWATKPSGTCLLKWTFRAEITSSRSRQAINAYHCEI